MNVIQLVENIVKEYLNENKYSNLIKLEKNVVDEIREKHSSLNKILSDKIFDKNNIYLKGGGARAGLIMYLNNEYDIIRDVDYVYVGPYKEYMNNIDYFNGNVDYEGDSIDNYMKNRDVTINEILLSRNYLIFSRRALRDYKKESIVPKQKYISSRLYSRMLLFSAKYNYNLNFNNLIFDYDDKDNFNLFICLLKAYELNIEYKYFDLCKKYDLTNNIYYISDWIYYLLDDMYGFDFYGREKLIIKDIIHNRNFEKIYDKFPELKYEVDAINLNDIDYINYIKKFKNKKHVLKYN
jgi:hypothetical protein